MRPSLSSDLTFMQLRSYVRSVNKLATFPRHSGGMWVRPTLQIQKGSPGRRQASWPEAEVPPSKQIASLSLQVPKLLPADPALPSLPPSYRPPHEFTGPSSLSHRCAILTAPAWHLRLFFDILVSAAMTHSPWHSACVQKSAPCGCHMCLLPV